MRFEVVAGTPGLALAEVAHILIPGRGRDRGGFGITREGLERVTVAKALHDEVVGARLGRIVCSGYKSPSDLQGDAWSPPDSPDEVFAGMPEADLMRAELVRMGVAENVVRVERHSVDTVTNLLRSEAEGHFGDRRPVAIVTHRRHLLRAMSIIAPRTLRRPYLGIAVPEERGGAESRLVRLASFLIAVNLPEDPERAVSIATRRAYAVHRVTNAVNGPRRAVGRGRPAPRVPAHTEVERRG